MNILHVTPHLGGGVGKAHAAIRAHDPDASSHCYALLETARDRRYAEAVQATGASIVEMPDENDLGALIDKADIVQIEFWNHPRLYEFLARTNLPAMRTLFWCHISGLSPPLIPAGLAAQAGAFVYTSACSIRDTERGNIHVIGSGFGLDAPVPRRKRAGKIIGGYLGTVDFSKMHPDFFAIVDVIDQDGFEILVFGDFDPAGPPVQAWRAMRHPERVKFMGHAANPADAFGELDFFFYPLAHNHFGTAENALVEAMSAGLACLVMDNPAERAIVTRQETGLLAHSVADCAGKLEKLIVDATLRNRLGSNAARRAAEYYQPHNAVAAFAGLYGALLGQSKTPINFASLRGTGPLDWYLGSFPEGSQSGASDRPSKGSLAHFLSCFPDDERLRRYAAAADHADGYEE
jgi:glycosyltransferase involved in cell wall biosynthesis